MKVRSIPYRTQGETLNAKQSIYEKIKDGTFALNTDAQIARKLRLGKKESAALLTMLRELVQEGKLCSDSRGRFGTEEQFGARRGVFSGNERGFGFFVPDDQSGDLFISHRARNGALHGDSVSVIPLEGGRMGNEGVVLRVLSRGYTSLVGTYRREKNAGYVRPDEKRYSEEVYIPLPKSKGCSNGTKVLVKITSFDRGPAGEVEEVLGESGDFFTEELALIRAHSLREEFPEQVAAEAERQERRGITEQDLREREDLRGELIFTVDGEDTRDIDDAISVSRDGDCYLLGVHIADVSHYVAYRGVIDKEAFKRGTSVYFPDRVLPMLPKALSNGICSLNEGVDRLTLSCFMKIDKSGRVLERRVAPTVIHSRHRMTYTEVTALYERDEETVARYPDLVETVDKAIALTRILKDARAQRGGVALDVKEAKILYQDGVVSIPDYERTISHEMIEQFMVLANESVAELMTARGAPFVYRIHERPAEEKANDFLEFLRGAGVAAEFSPARVTPTDYRDLLHSLEKSPLYPLVNRVMLRSMAKAKYAPKNVGHFGLASDCYCHFTSPIRRYPDLVVHRIIHESFTLPAGAKSAYQSFVEEAATQSSACEKNATDAERDVDALYTVAYMKDRIGETYEATVSGVTSFGLFAELDNTVEGFIPIETLPDDYYDFSEERFLLKGTKNVFRLGDRLFVQVASVDWGQRRTHFQLLKKL